jgi:L-alanine-DL-glutamate epimerase-like enolase superfamily enzyme
MTDHALNGQRLTDVRIGALTTRYPRIIGRNARLPVHGIGPTSTTVSLRTDQGVEGWGLLCGRLDNPADFVGMPLDELFDPALGVLTDTALPLDLALHDLAGRILNQPVHAMLGSETPIEPPCYDGAIYLDDVHLDEKRGLRIVLDNCAADHARGFRAFKLKIGRGHRWMEHTAGIRRDIAVTRAVREAYPDADILVDANDGYRIEDFRDYLAGVADCGLFWIEEPFVENRSDLAELREFKGNALVADGESDPDLDQLLEFAAAGLIDVLLMDVVTFGLTPWRRIMPTVREMAVKASPHAWGVPIKSIYAGHIAAGLGNVVAVEGVPGRCAGMRLDVRDGRLRLPAGPGFGIAPPK